MEVTAAIATPCLKRRSLNVLSNVTYSPSQCQAGARMINNQSTLRTASDLRTNISLTVLFGKKGKAVQLQAWSGPEGSRKLRFPDFVTTAQDGGKVVSLTHRSPLPPGNTPGTHFC